MNRKIILAVLGATLALNLLANPGSNNGNKKNNSGKNIPVILPAHRPVADIPVILPSQGAVADIPTTLPSHHRPVVNTPTTLPSHRPVADIPTTLPSHRPVHTPTTLPSHRPVHTPTTLPSHKPVHTPTILPSHRPVYDWRHDNWYNSNDYYQKNWGYSKDSFRRWLNRHPHLSRRDKKALEKLYKEQLAYERKLRKKFAKYNREISTLPAYRHERDPMGTFIEDYLYNRDSMRNYRFSDNFRREMSREEREAAEFFRFIRSFR